MHFLARDSTFAKGSEEYVDIDGVDAAEAEGAVVTEKELADKLTSLENKVLRHENVKFNEVNDKIATLESKIDTLCTLMASMAPKSKSKKGSFF